MKKKPKNIILLVGDGMDPQQLGILYSYYKWRDQLNKTNYPRFYGFDQISKNGRLLFVNTFTTWNDRS